MKKILVFGTFDILHPGHLHFLRAAKKMGDELSVVIARDETVIRIKGRLPHHNEKQRLENIKQVPPVDHAYLGNKGDKYRIIEKINPDIICLGYDQKAFTENLSQELQRLGVHAKILRMDKGYKPHIYKSSILREKIKKNIENHKKILK